MCKRLLAGVLLAATLAIGVASAQPAPTTPVSGFNPTTSASSEQKLLGTLKQIDGRITIPDRKAAVLEQPAGRDWRDFQRGTIPKLAAVAVLGMLVVLIAFYALRGRIAIEGGPSGRLIERFGAFERFVHWMTASSWVVLALTGLNVAVGRHILPGLIGEHAFAELSDIGKLAHNYLGFPFALGVLLMLFIWVRHNIPNGVDITWFRQGGGLVGRAHPSAGKFNGGQKAVFWIVVLGGGLIAASGFVLLFPFYITDIAGMQTAQMVHGVLALLMIAAMLGHIYIGTVGMEGAFEAMGNGQVDEKWARAHHDLWVAELEARKGAAE
ncbi:MAG: formate dehydrogenase subunit gamma [Rhodospirillales bacterium 70-18]|nr:MAG: formate dehydrogenase subunit gamma [Rhodospirillales bacterium 70-18]